MTKQYAVWLHACVDATDEEEATQAVTASLEYSTLPMSVEIDDVIEVEADSNGGLIDVHSGD